MATSNLEMKDTFSLCWKSNFLVALAAFWVNFCLLGILRSNSVIYSALVDVFEISRQYAAWPSGVFGIVMSSTGLISGVLTNYLSIRTLCIFGIISASLSVSACSLVSQMQHIILLYGAFQGIGYGLIIPLTHVVLNQNFTKYRSCAVGIAYSGASVGMFVFPPLTNYLLKIYDLDGAFLLIGGIMLNAVLGAILFNTPKKLQLQKRNCDKITSDCQRPEVPRDIEKDHPESNSIKYDKEEFDVKKCDTKSNFAGNECEIQSAAATRFSRICSNLRKRQNVLMAIEIVTSPYFHIITLLYSTYHTSLAILLMTILDFARDRGIKSDDGVFLVSVYSIGDFIGRLTTGWIADLQIVRRITVVRLYITFMGIMLIIFPWLPYSGMYAVSIALGVSCGGLIANQSVLLNEYLGLQKLPMAMGFSFCIAGTTAYVFLPIIVGFFRDYLQSYELLFVSMGILQFFIASLWFLEVIIPVLRKRCFVNRTEQ